MIGATQVCNKIHEFIKYVHTHAYVCAQLLAIATITSKVCII